jgi:hypothetical protein
MIDYTLRYTLLSDGSSDTVLIPILTWLLEQHLPDYSIESAWADFRSLRRPPKLLPEKIRLALEYFPCDLLFIHRDAENQAPQWRVQEIRQALNEAAEAGYTIPVVCVIPVRMQEAWLLIDEKAIRKAANNPNGRNKLDMPHIHELEGLADPKEVLYQLLRDASEYTGRRLKQFRPEVQVHRINDFIEDFSVLFQLAAFETFHLELQECLSEQGWLSI